MGIRFNHLATGVALFGVLVAGIFANSADAANANLTTKEKAVIAVYAKAISKARSDYFAAVGPSRTAVDVLGNPAETKRRTAVIAALITYMTVVHTEKAPVLAAELAYRNAASRSASNPTDVSLRADTKSKLDTLNKASASLKVDRIIATARATFSKSRITALAKFKSTLAVVVAKRNSAEKNAFAKFKVAKANALTKFKAALKSLHSKIIVK